MSEEQVKLGTAHVDLESKESRQVTEATKLRLKEDDRRKEKNSEMIKIQKDLQKEIMEMMMKYNNT